MRSLTITFLFFPFFAFPNTDLLDYIEKYKFIAIQEMNRTGIPASITLAQGIIESRFGTSGLAQNANNHFGIKCNNNWTGGGYYQKDDDYKNGKLIDSCFRTYASAEESYYDHSEFLMQNQRYAFLFNYSNTNYRAWAKGLKKAGYATAKHYASVLIETIEEHKLYEYDLEETFLSMHADEGLVPPKAVSIADYAPTYTTSQIETGSITTETLVAAAPPQPVVLPTHYQPGDGLKKVNRQSNFYQDVYGGSSKYLDVITPQIASRD